MKLGSYIVTLVALFWLGLGPGLVRAQAAESVPVKSGRVTAQLVTSYDRVLPGDDIYVALSLRMEPHWHTYWRNAGGPGYPADIQWTLPENLTVDEMIWSLPQIILTGENRKTEDNTDIPPNVSYAFENRLLLPMKLHVSGAAKTGDLLTIRAEASYLVCYEVCLPETATLTLPLMVGERVGDNRWSANINRTIETAPKIEAGFEASAKLQNNTLIIDIKSEALRSEHYKNPYFFPYVQDIIDADMGQVLTQGAAGLRLSMTQGWQLENGLTEPVQGVIAFDTKIDGAWKRRGVIVTAYPDTTLDIGAIASVATSNPNTATGLSLGFALFSAFLGGMILNLMPCVFPILSLKALGFAKAAHEDAGLVRKHGLSYTLGVLVSFMALAVTLLALKAGGAAIGWGFQLQSPIMVAGLALLFMAIALNLFGFFELSGGWQNTGSELAEAGGVKGAFFTGVLAVIVATPCTAPFMAGALGYALAQPPLSALLVFFALGLGFALPFLALSFAPKLLRLLPKPGAWMEMFKQLLAFPMLAAAIWLLWVLAAVGGDTALITTLFAGLALTLGIWAFKYESIIAKTLAIFGGVLCVFLIFNLKPAPAITQTTAEQSWSTERVAQLRAEGHPVFVDFTARWCVTCKVNEKLVLHTQKGRALFADTGTKVLIADWTRKDDRIAQELARHGRSGVPLYLLYSASGTESPQILPQNLTIKSLEKALKTAQSHN